MFHLRERFDHRDLELIQYYELQFKGISPNGKLFYTLMMNPSQTLFASHSNI
jgi:hypothetical protein